jgi:hypothetical protein
MNVGFVGYRDRPQWAVMAYLPGHIKRFEKRNWKMNGKMSRRRFREMPGKILRRNKRIICLSTCTISPWPACE